jgi:hypothetical protein
LNRYYNNPNIGAAMENIASIFAPPSAQDIAGYALADKARTEARGLESLYGMAGDPDADMGAFDRWGAATGQWNPNQGFGARDMSDATTRRGDDIQAGTQRYGYDTQAATQTSNNVRDNQTRAITELFGARDPYHDQPAAPDEFMDVIGLPGVPAMPGRDKPLSETEVEGAILSDAYGQGLVGTKDAADIYRGDIPIEQVIGADIDGDGKGDPVNVARGSAIGRQPYTNPGSAPAKGFKSWTSPSTQRSGIAITDPATGTITDNASGQPLPPDAIIGDVTDAGGGVFSSTTSNQTDATKSEAEVNFYLGRVNAMRDLLTNNPGIAGAPGMIRGFVQDAQAFSREMTAAYGDDPIMPEDVGAMAERFGAAGDYDPAIRRFRALAVELAYAKAKAADPSGEVNVREFEQHFNDFNGGLAGNEGVIPPLDELEDSLRSRLTSQVQTLRNPGQQPPPSNKGAVPPAEGTTPAGTRWRVVQ